MRVRVVYDWNDWKINESKLKERELLNLKRKKTQQLTTQKCDFKCLKVVADNE